MQTKKLKTLALACLMGFLALPAITFAGATEQNYYTLAHAYRISSGGTGGTMSGLYKTVTQSDHLEIYASLPNYLSNQNYVGMSTNLAYPLDNISLLYVDYDATITSGSCELTIHFGNPTTGPSLFSWSTSTNASRTRRIETDTVSRTGNQTFVPLIRQNGANTCVGTFRVYDIYDEDGNSYLDFIDIENIGGNSTTTLDVDLSSTTEAIQNLNDTTQTVFLVFLWFTTFFMALKIGSIFNRRYD